MLNIKSKYVICWTNSIAQKKIIPYAIRKTDYHYFGNYCADIEVAYASNELVPDSAFFCLDTDRNIMVGAVNIRHFLKESLLLNGGHIGDDVAPSERRKGIAIKMIALALDECRRLGIEKVLMVCDKENIGSAKGIQNNGGVLETERLILREYVTEDFDALFEIVSDIEAMRHYPLPFDEDKTRSWIQWNLDNYKKYGYGFWAVVLKEMGEFVGDCGITIQDIDGEMLPEIGYHIHKKYWRKDFAKVISEKNIADYS